MVSRFDDAEWLGVSPSLVLRAAKEVERAHRHGQIGFFGKALNQAVENGVFDVSVNFHPTGGSEYALHGVLGAKNQEVNHISGIPLFVADAACNLSDMGGVHARHLA